MIEHFFLTYANNSFLNDPNNLYKIHSEITTSFQKHRYEDFKLQKFIITLIVKFAKQNDPREARKWMKQLFHRGDTKIHGADNRVWLLFDLVNVSYNAVYGYNVCNIGYKYGNCGTKLGSCKYYLAINYSGLLKEHELESSARLKCYECHQLRFVSFLSSLTKGGYLGLVRPFNKLGAQKKSDLFKLSEHFRNVIYLKRIVKHAYDGIETTLELDENGKLKQISLVDKEKLLYKDSPYPRITKFNDYIFSLVGYSLTEFMKNIGLKKLHRCPYCHEFYISKNARRFTRCYSKDCNKAYQRDKKRKQREKEPEIYCY